MEGVGDFVAGEEDVGHAQELSDAFQSWVGALTRKGGYDGKRLTNEGGLRECGLASRS